FIEDFFLDEIQQRRHQHRNRHRQNQQIGGGLVENLESHRAGENDESKLAALRQNQRQLARIGGGAAQCITQHKQYSRFQRHQQRDETCDQQRLTGEQRQIHHHAHRLEKQAEQQTLE